jgi:hypothetical protein
MTKTIKPPIYRLQDRINKLIKEQSELIAETQRKCKHTKVAECEYTPLNMGGAFPPRRKCFDCLWEEDGWGCGWKKTNNAKEVIEMSRDDLYKMRVYGKENWNG